MSAEAQAGVPAIPADIERQLAAAVQQEKGSRWTRRIGPSPFS